MAYKGSYLSGISAGAGLALLALVPFSLVVHEDRVRAVLGGRPVGEFPLAGVAHTMALFVNRATASFRALVVHRPVS